MDGDEFLRRMRKGDIEVWKELIPVLRKIVSRICWDKGLEQDIDDIVQNVAIKFFTTWENYKGESKLTTYLYTIALNSCRDELRKINASKKKAKLAPLEESNQDDEDTQTVGTGLLEFNKPDIDELNEHSERRQSNVMLLEDNSYFDNEGSNEQTNERLETENRHSNVVQLKDYSSTIEDHHDSNFEQSMCIQQMIEELESQPPARKGSMRIIDVLRWCAENSPTTEELAQFMQTSLSAAKERKSYILKQVRELCSQFCGHDDCTFSKQGG